MLQDYELVIWILFFISTQNLQIDLIMHAIHIIYVKIIIFTIIIFC